MKKYLSWLIARLIRLLKEQHGDLISYGDMNFWQVNGFSIIPNHYYSPVPDLSTLKPDVFAQKSLMPGINLKIEKQMVFLHKLALYQREMKNFAYMTSKIDSQKDHKFYFNNLAFDFLDACLYYCLIRHLKPNIVLEVGSGWSTKIAAAAALKNKDTRVVSIEPYPQPILKKGFPGLSRLIEKKIEEVPINFFNQLRENDILFIDSSHTVKTAGDVNYLFLEVLPRLKKGVWVHIHDIFLPREYPEYWIKKEYRFWNEQYLLQAFLLFNDRFEVVLANNLIAREKGSQVKKLFPVLKKIGGGSCWIRRVK